MADVFDKAQDLDALMLQSHLNKHQAEQKRKPKVQATGKCLYCGEELAEGLRWCDADCRDDWQKENPGL